MHISLLSIEVEYFFFKVAIKQTIKIIIFASYVFIIWFIARLIYRSFSMLKISIEY